MKPLQLKMTAFGPYKNEETVDFRELKNNRLFVISGQTGAGKTTIFDAICFALYGSSSGSDRDQTKMLRSDFANDDTHTAVEFLFEIRQRTYRVLRQLSHVKQGRKTATGEKYELYEVLADGTEIAVVERQRVSDINPKLEEIIGLTYDQFSQIVMLPQGEFRKLLTSQSDNKEAILRKIFKTDRYGKMAKRLEEKKQAAEQRAKGTKAKRDSYIEQLAGALPHRDSELFDLLQTNGNVYQILNALQSEFAFYEAEQIVKEQQYKEALLTYQKAYEAYTTAKALNDQLDELAVTKQKLIQLVEQKPQFDLKKKQIEAAHRAVALIQLDENCLAINAKKKQCEANLEQATYQLEQAQQAYATAQQLFEKEKANESARLQMKEELSRLQAMKPHYEQIEIVEKELIGASKTTDVLKTELSTLTKQADDAEQKLTEYKQKLNELDEVLQTRQVTYESLVATEKIVDLFEKYEQASYHVNLEQPKVDEAEELYIEQKTKYDQFQKMWLSNQAYHLASKLHDGDACPVCGSIEHPNKVQLKQEGLTEQQLIAEEQCLQKLQAKRDELKILFSTLKEKQKFYTQELQSQSISLHEKDAYHAKLKDLQIRNEQMNGIAQQVQNLKQQIETIENEIKQNVAKQKIKEANKNEAEKHVIQYTASIENMKKQMDDSIPSYALLVEKITATNQNVTKLEQDWEKAQQSFNHADKQLAMQKQSVQYIEEQMKILLKEMQEAKERFVQKLKESSFENYQAYKEAVLSDEQINELMKHCEQYTSTLYAVEQKAQELEQQLQGVEKQELTQLQMHIDVCKEQQEQMHKAWNDTKDCMSQCEKFHKALETIAQEIYDLEQVVNQITDVHNLLKGQNSKKISFERYVQIGYLQQITEAANIRLKNLSNGQYMLICSDRQEAHGRASGLSLDVYDSYTGQTRDVKTLSGGEKFNASLSLALGMADVIQSYQGNVRIDTMFIDEGFGSLDEESLMRAIDTLIELQNAGRMIGVISHVSELKDAIPAVLHVVKSKSGHSETKFEIQ